MKIHEYQAKAILAKYNVPVPRGEVAFTVAEAETAAKNSAAASSSKRRFMPAAAAKAAASKSRRDAEEAAQIAEKMLGMTLVTHQTGPEGQCRAAAARRRNAAHR